MADGGKGVAVLGAGTVFGDGVAVLLGAVSFVLGKAIVGELFVQGNQVAVAGDFGQNGGGSNAEALAVAAHDCFLGNVELGEADTAVYQQKLGWNGKLGNGRLHGQLVGGQNANLINHMGGLLTDTVCQGMLANDRKEGVSLFGGELFRVVYTEQQGFDLVIQRQDDGGGHHWASQRATPGLVDSGNVGELVLLGNGRFQRQVSHFAKGDWRVEIGD